jgi:hypothetical protein
VGWQLRARSLSLAGEYDLGYRRLGGDPYLTAHRLLASAVWGRRRTLGATYSVRLEDFAGDFRDYSGVVHRGEVRFSLPAGTAARLGVAYGAARDLADAEDLSYVEHGPRADLWVAVGGRARVALELGVAFRRYDAPGPTTAIVRDEVTLDATALGEVDLGPRLVLRGALVARRNRSSLDALDHDRILPSVGLLWVAGVP